MRADPQAESRSPSVPPPNERTDSQDVRGTFQSPFALQISSQFGEMGMGRKLFTQLRFVLAQFVEHARDLDQKIVDTRFGVLAGFGQALQQLGSLPRRKATIGPPIDQHDHRQYQQLEYLFIIQSCHSTSLKRPSRHISI